METTENQAVQPQSPLSVESIPPKNGYKIALFMVLGLILVSGLAYAGMTFGKKQSPLKIVQPPIAPTSTPMPYPIEITQTITETPTSDKTGSWETFTSDEFGISFKMPKSFYWNGGQTTGEGGPFIKPYTLGLDTTVVTNSGKVSCNLMGKYLKDPTTCNDNMSVNNLLVNYKDSRNPHTPVFSIGTPSWVSFEDSIGCGDNVCTYRYEDDVTILGKVYKVRIYYEKVDTNSPPFTRGILIEGEVPASINSKWKSFDIQPFIGFSDGASSPFGVGLSKVSRLVLSTLTYK